VTLESMNSGRRWPILNGRPVFTPDGVNAIQHSEHHISNPLTEEAVRIINRARGRVLNLSAGGTSKRYPNVIEVEYSIFRNTDIVADAHNLPFGDEVFDAVVCLNAFEHYREPDVVMKNIHRILKPGGKLYLHTAFLQPLHEPPYHYFNCTEFGLAQWLQNFNIEAIQVSDNFNPVHSFSWLASELEIGLSSSVSAKAAKEFQSARVGEFVKLWRNEAGRKGPLWNNFFALSSDHQRKLSAGWEAVARK
jgi:SAM-dependent methyltransferase